MSIEIKERPVITTQDRGTWPEEMRLDIVQKREYPAEMVSQYLLRYLGWHAQTRRDSGPVVFDEGARTTIDRTVQHLSTIWAMDSKLKELAEFCWAQYYLALIHASGWCESRQRSQAYGEGGEPYHAVIPVYRVLFSSVMESDPNDKFDLCFRREKVYTGPERKSLKYNLGMYELYGDPEGGSVTVPVCSKYDGYAGKVVANNTLFGHREAFFKTSVERPWVGVHT